MKPSKKNLLRNLAVVLIASQASRLLVDALAADGYQWQWHDVAMHATVCALVWFVFWVLPYERIGAKCAALTWMGFEIVPLAESVLRAFDVETLPYTIAWQCAVALVLAVWYLRRSCDFTGDQINDSHVFICRLRPRGIQDLILAMLGKSGLGGVAIYYKRQLWHYRRGVLVKEYGFRQHHRYVPINAGLPSALTIRTLDELVGTRWSPLRNCLTMLYATVKFGAPLLRPAPSKN